MITFKVITFEPVRFPISNSGLLCTGPVSAGTAPTERPSILGNIEATGKYFRSGFCRSVSSFSGGVKVSARVWYAQGIGFNSRCKEYFGGGGGELSQL